MTSKWGVKKGWVSWYEFEIVRTRGAAMLRPYSGWLEASATKAHMELGIPDDGEAHLMRGC